jgi:hypothetical protein
VTYRVLANILVEADDADEAYKVLSDHFAKLARHEWSDLVLPGSESIVETTEEQQHEQDAG